MPIHSSNPHICIRTAVLCIRTCVYLSYTCGSDSRDSGKDIAKTYPGDDHTRDSLACNRNEAGVRFIASSRANTQENKSKLDDGRNRC
ncbi:hypothetical protein Trydic_g17868 [Trypoxylus dichotomus]